MRGFSARRHAALVRLTLAYALFAAVATAVNLGVQWGVEHAASAAAPWTGGLVARVAALVRLTPARLLLAPELVAGTGAGLVVKYLLDKRFIFRDRVGGAAQHVRKFGLYAVMGLATTALFWGAEIAAAALSTDPQAKYLGGALGLMVGYVVKYRLDRRFVFVQANQDAAAEAPAIDLPSPSPAVAPAAVR